MILIGKIRRPWRNKGELVIDSYSSFPERFKNLKKIKIEGEVDFIEVEKTTVSENLITIKLKGIDDLKSAYKFKGAKILIEEEDLYSLPDNDYYYVFELRGCSIYSKDNKFLGKVKDIAEQNDYFWLISDYNEMMIPFVKEICISVDLENKRIEIDPPEGLTQLNEI
ncbi:MAG: ribosome maturation factor RimM [Acidobacteriota bacterium]